jgi:hypothetical protein
MPGDSAELNKELLSLPVRILFLFYLLLDQKVAKSQGQPAVKRGITNTYKNQITNE